MSLKAFILLALFFATTICGMAQESSTVYSQNKEANSYYSKALDYIKIGNPRNGGSVDFIQSNDSIINKNFINKSGLRADHQKGAILIRNDELSLAQWNGDELWENNLEATDIMVSGPVLRMNNDDAILAKNIFYEKNGNSYCAGSHYHCLWDFVVLPI